MTRKRKKKGQGQKYTDKLDPVAWSSVKNKKRKKKKKRNKYRKPPVTPPVKTHDSIIWPKGKKPVKRLDKINEINNPFKHRKKSTINNLSFCLSMPIKNNSIFGYFASIFFLNRSFGASSGKETIV